MDDLIENHNWHMVVAYTVTGANIGFRSFTGDTADSQAREHFEKLKEYAEANEIWMAKLGRRTWETVMAVERVAGHWVPVTKT